MVVIKFGNPLRNQKTKQYRPETSGEQMGLKYLIAVLPWGKAIYESCSLRRLCRLRGTGK